jgi:hypothetical protein
MESKQIIGNRFEPKENYSEALVPFGINWTLIILIVITIAVLFVAIKAAGPYSAPNIFVPILFALFIGVSAYDNFFPSSFQKKRDVIASFYGGGSIGFFNTGTAQSFKLLVYKDGLEIRVLLHRFFIPFEKIKEISAVGSFLNRGILIKSDLPSVPTEIRFNKLAIQKVIQSINEAKSKYLDIASFRGQGSP